MAFFKPKFTPDQYRLAKDELTYLFPNLVEWAAVGVGGNGLRVGWQRRGKGRPKLPKEVKGVPIETYWIGKVVARGAAAKTAAV